MATEAMAIEAMTRAERERERKRSGQKQRKRLHVLRNPTKLAFRGWEAEVDPWSIDTCASYIEWCHIDKVFPEVRHNCHRRFHKANLRYCTDPAFVERCIEVYQVLYERATVERNEVHLFLARGVHAEIKLNKRVDWSTLKERGNKITIPHPSNGLIPMGIRRFPEGGLGHPRPLNEGSAEKNASEDSSIDPDSDGTHAPPRAPTVRTQRRSRKRRNAQVAREEAVGVAHEVNEVNEPVLEAREGDAHIPVPVHTGEDLIGTLRRELQSKITETHLLYEQGYKAQRELHEKTAIIEEQSQEIERLRRALEATSITDVTGLQVQEQGHGEDVAALRSENTELQNKLDAVVSQYYEWKLACVWSVDKNRQMAAELRKVAKHYFEHNQERVFGLTSWADVEELFDMDNMATKMMVGNEPIIDWAKHDWAFETATSPHSTTEGQLLWPRPSSFVSDGTKCPICLNFFGPEGGIHLGTCEHLYHPICLISLMINRRRCVMCKAPFHKRLYELFNLVDYMPPHWEFTPDNAPDHPQEWGHDLVWNWRYKYHSLEKSLIGESLGWDNNPTEIVRLSHQLIKGSDSISVGKRNFFYQCFNGHWDERTNQFRFGPHPLNWIWTVEGVRITDDDGHINMEDVELGMPTPRERVMMSESEWRDRFKSEAIDFLLDAHSPQTRQALEELQQSQVLRALLEENGPARNTRSSVRRLRLGSNEGHIPLRGTHDNEAGASGTANSAMDLD